MQDDRWSIAQRFIMSVVLKTRHRDEQLRLGVKNSEARGHAPFIFASRHAMSLCLQAERAEPTTVLNPSG